MNAQGKPDIQLEERRVLAEHHFRQELQVDADRLTRRPIKYWVILRISAVVILAFLAHVNAQSRRVHRIDARYQLVQPGIDSGVLFTTMKEDTVDILFKGGWDDEMKGWWDDVPLSIQEESRIETAHRYSARGLFKTVSWVFTFDKNEKLVGKHRFD